MITYDTYEEAIQNYRIGWLLNWREPTEPRFEGGDVLLCLCAENSDLVERELYNYVGQTRALDRLNNGKWTSRTLINIELDEGTENGYWNGRFILHNKKGACDKCIKCINRCKNSEPCAFWEER